MPPSEGRNKLSVHVMPVKTYILVFLALMALTAITVGAAFLDLGVLNTVIMLGIAGTKASSSSRCIRTMPSGEAWPRAIRSACGMPWAKCARSARSHRAYDRA